MLLPRPRGPVLAGRRFQWAFVRIEVELRKIQAYKWVASIDAAILACSAVCLP